MDVIYDEKNKFYTIKNTKMKEVNISINKNNELRKLANVTTLTNDDINLLYSYAKLKYKNKQNKMQFLNEPLKFIFPVDSSINQLMVLAHNYVINKTDLQKNINNKSNYLVYLLVFIIFLLNIFAIYYLYNLK